MFWLIATGRLVEGRRRSATASPPRRSTGTSHRTPSASRRAGFTGCWGSVHRFPGLAAATAGRPDDARAHFEAALDRHTALGGAPLVARTRRYLHPLGRDARRDGGPPAS
jgi:hypothetical protein